MAKKPSAGGGSGAKAGGAANAAPSMRPVAAGPVPVLEAEGAPLAQEPYVSAAAPIAAPDPGAEAGKVLIVVGPKQGRRRAGRAFGLEPAHIPLGELSGDELAALTGDPELSCRIEGAA